MPVIDLSFLLQGSTIPLDYGYSLFSALSRLAPALHGNRRIGVHPIRGVRLEPRRLTLLPQSRLRLRLPSEEVASYLTIAGSRIDLDGSALSVGIPSVEHLRPSTTLVSRLVTIGRLIDSGIFEESIGRQLRSIGVSAAPSLVRDRDPARIGSPARRVVRIKGKRIVGYPVRIEGLTAEESLIVQEQGLGSRRRMGCGVFVRQGEIFDV